MSFSQKLPILQRTEFPMSDVEITIKYFTMPFPNKTNLLLYIMKKFNLLESLSKKKTTEKLSTLNLKSLYSSFSLSNFSKRDIDSIEQNLAVGHVFKLKEIKLKLQDDQSEKGVTNLFKLDALFSEFTNNTEHFILFLIINSFIDNFESPTNELSVFDFLKIVEPLFVYMFRYFIRHIYQFKNKVQKYDLLLSSALVIRTFLRLSSLFDQQNEHFMKNKNDSFTEADNNLFNTYDVETHKLLADIYSGLIDFLQTHEIKSITDPVLIDFLNNIEQFSCSCLQKRHTILPLLNSTTLSTTPFITFEIHQFLLLSSIHKVNICFHQSFSSDQINQVIKVLVSLLTVEPNSQSFKELKDKMVADGVLKNTPTNNASIILFGPFIDISKETFNYMISLLKEEQLKEDDRNYENKKESISKFSSFMLSSMIRIVEKDPELSDDCSNADLYSLVSNYLISNMKSFAKEILENLENAFSEDINQFAQIDCNCEFHPLVPYESSITDNRIRNFIPFPKCEDLEIHVFDSTKDYISQCAISFNAPEYYQKIIKQSPKFEKLMNIQFKSKKDSIFIRNVLMKLTPIILSDYSSFGINIEDKKDYSENVLMLYFLIILILASSNETISQLFHFFDLLNILSNLFVFDVKYFPLVKDEKYSQFNPVHLFLYHNLRYSVLATINRNFKNFPSEVIELLITKIDTTNSLEISNMFQILLNEIYASNIPEFLHFGMNNEKLFPVLIDYVAKMRKCFYLNANKYIELKALNKKENEEQLKGNLKYIHEIHECRKSVMLFLILLTLESNTIYTLYSKEAPVSLMADECFENIFSKIALDFLLHGLEIVDTRYSNSGKESHKSPLVVVSRVVMRLIFDCVRQSEKLIDQRRQYLNLILDTLIIMKEAIQVNQQPLIKAFVRCNILPLLLLLPERLILGSKKKINNNGNNVEQKDEKLEDLKIDILDQVIYIICALAKGNNDFKKVSYKHLIKFANFLRKRKLKDSTINALLQLLFEKEVSLHNLQEICEILFNHALIILHTSLEKDYQHYLIVFEYISKIAQHSYANRLRIFQANFPHFIINYLTRQNKQTTVNYESNEELDARIKSIEVLWKIYQVVSTDLYKPSTFVNSFYLMKVKNKQRYWYTSRILSIFGNILSKKVSQKTASSYFHFSSRKSGIYVPRIDLTTKLEKKDSIQKVAQQDDNSDNEIADGTWTFCCVFLIDNIVYEYSINNSCLVSFTSQSSLLPTNSQPNKKVFPSKLKLILNPPELFLVFESPVQNFVTKEKLNMKFRPCVWYNLVLTISKLKYIKIYINGTKIFHKNINQLDLSPVLENFSVANSFSCPFSINKNYNILSIRKQRNQEMINDLIKNLNSDNDSSLICNLACCYLFCKKLSHLLVSDIAKLPFDYVYSFISSNQYLFSNLPESLFTGEIEQSLVFCYNARLCDNKNVCINLKRNGKVGNGIFNGDIVPYNLTSITSFGGLKIFLPLFDQIDLPIDHTSDICHVKEDTEAETNEERRQFLVTLLTIYSSCIHLSEEVENTFCNEKGIKALCHELTVINPDDWSIEAFKLLYQMYVSLRSEQNKFEMVQYILVNPNVWQNLSVKNHNELKDACLMTLVQSNLKNDHLNIFLKYAPFTHFLITVLTIKNDEIRSIYWNIIVTYARYGLVKPNETQRLFIFAFSDDSFYRYHEINYINQIQALKALYKIVSNKFCDFHMFLTNSNHFYHFILLAQSNSEVIRMYGLKFLLLIKEYMESKAIIDIPPIPINQAFIAYINLMSLESVSHYSWDELLKLVFKDDEGGNDKDSLSHRIVDTLPFMAILSNFTTSDQIKLLGKNILQSIEDSFDPFKKKNEKQEKDNNFCEFISQSLNWVENLFYIFIQGSDKFDFNNHEDENYVRFVKIFASVFTYLLLNDRNNQFSNCLNSLNLIQYFTSWDVASFIRSIFIEMLKQMNDFILESKDDKVFHNVKNNYENLYNNLVSSIFLYLFVIPSFEATYNNPELSKTTNTNKENETISVIEERISHNDYIQLQLNQSILKTKLSASFTQRFDENGKWLDLELSEHFSTFLTNVFNLHMKTKNYNFGSTQIYSKPTKIIDLFAINEMLLIKALNKPFNEIINQKFTFLNEMSKSNTEDVITCIAIIIHYAHPLNKDENRNKKYSELTQIMESYIKSHPGPKVPTASNETDSNEKSGIHNTFEYSTTKTNEFISSIVNRYQSSIPGIIKNSSLIVASLINTYKAKSYKFPISPIDGSFFVETTNQYISTLSHMSGICENAYRDLRRDVLKNSGLWKSNESDPQHWKLSPYLDNEFRHNLFEPNYLYTDHIDASIRRDVGDESVAKEKIAAITQNKEDNKSQEKTSSGIPNDKVNNENSADNDIDNDEIENDSKKTYIINTQARLVTIEGNFYGFLSMNGKEIFFTGTLEDDDDELLYDSFSSSNSKEIQKLEESTRNTPKKPRKSIEISLKSIIMILRRNYLHIQSAFEIFLKTNRSYFFFLPNNDRRNVFRFMAKQNMPNLKYFQISSEMNSFISEFKITEKWQRKKISNYQYLVCLNLCAGRSFNDLSQYPVFPWVLTNFKSDKLDLDDISNFRDLSKPLGTLNEERLEKLKFSCENRPEVELPPFLYRLHYSTAYNVCAFMIRVEPFTSIYLKLNGGRFDIKERIINSLGQIWDAVTSYQNEFRELIPEVYTTPEIFMNYNKIDLGGINKSEALNTNKNKKSDIELIINEDTEDTQNNSQIDYYKGSNDFLLLPPWANSNPFLFISKHREALESDFVSMHLNEWIDLIFGIKQMGELADKANNTFHPYSYSTFVTPQVLKDRELMRDIQLKIRDFGITPQQIFKYEYHPTRFEPILDSPLSHQSSGPISFITSFFKRKNPSKNQTTPTPAAPTTAASNEKDVKKEVGDEIDNENSTVKPFFGHFHSVTEFDDENRPVFVSGNRRITVIFTINAHLYVFKNLHKNNKNEEPNNQEQNQNKPDLRYVLLSLYDISQFVTLTELKSRRLKNCCTLFDNIILSSKLQGEKMNFFIVSSPDDISFHIFEINENNGAVSHVTSSHGQAILKQIVSRSNSTKFMASSKDTSLSCFSIKGEDSSSVFSSAYSQQGDGDVKQLNGIVSQVVSVTSNITNFISPITLSPKKGTNAQLVSCSSVPSLANMSIELEKTFRILTHSAPIVDLNESATENMSISADEMNKVIFTSLFDGSYIRSLTFTKIPKVKIILNDNCDPNLIKLFKSASTNTSDKTKMVTLNARQRVKLVMISDGPPCALIATTLNIMLPNQNTNLKLNANYNSNSNANTSDFSSTSGLFSTGPQYFLTQEENSLILSDIRDTLLMSNENSEAINNNESGNVSEILNHSQFDIGESNNNNKNDADTIPNLNFNDYDKGFISTTQEIDSKQKSNRLNDNYIIRSVLYSYDLDGHLIHYKLVNSRIISWCEVKPNASSPSKLVVAFSNKSICAYSLPCLELISSITLPNIPTIIYYNEDRNKLIIVQEGNEYSVSTLNLGI